MESLRVMPPVPVSARIAKETGIIEGIVVPAGTLIYIPVRSPHLDVPKVAYAGCERFER
jgi:cytochrome P450